MAEIINHVLEVIRILNNPIGSLQSEVTAYIRQRPRRYGTYSNYRYLNIEVKAALDFCIRSMIMYYFHDGSLGVHLGMNKTLKRIKQQFFWPMMDRDVKRHIRVCETCKRSKLSLKSNVGLHSADVSERPLQRLFLDFMGPIVRSKSGNTVILSVCDGFSKFIWLFPMRKISAKGVVEKLQIHLFGCFGIPETMVTDNASVFRSKVFRDMCFRWGIRAITTSPYYPKGSHVERVHRNLKAAPNCLSP